MKKRENIFKKPVCHVCYDDTLEDIIRKSLKAMKQCGIDNHKEEYYKELASQMTGRIRLCKDERTAMMIVRYYVHLICTKRC